RALVAQKRPEPTGARPAATGVATNGDRAGSSEDQHAGLPIERAEESRLSVRHDQDPVREAVQALRQAPALTLGPDALRRDDERASRDVRARLSRLQLLTNYTPAARWGGGALVAPPGAPRGGGGAGGVLSPPPPPPADLPFFFAQKPAFGFLPPPFGAPPRA